MSIKQFSAHYAPLEDRIVLHLNTTEGEVYSFLVTRAIAKSLSLHAQSAVEQLVAVKHSARSSKIISEFQKEGLKKQLNFEESFEGGSHSPLGTEPVLIAQVTVETVKESVAIAFTLTTNQILRFTLLAVQVQAFTLLLERLAQQADWRLHEPSISLEEEPAAGNSQPASQIH